MRSATVYTSVNARDPGLGMVAHTLYVPTTTSYPNDEAPPGTSKLGQFVDFASDCQNRITRCPEYFSHTFSFTTDQDLDTRDVAPGIQRVREGSNLLTGGSYDVFFKSTPYQAGTLKVDRTAPNTGGIAGVSEGELLRDRGYTITGNASDPLSGAKEVEVTLDGIRRAYRSNCPATTSSCSVAFTLDGGDPTLTAGTHTLRVNARDQVGNGFTTVATRTFQVERTPPEFTEADVQGTLKAEDREWVASGKQSLLIDAFDAQTGVVAAEVRIDGQPVKDGQALEAIEPCLASGCPELSYDFLIDTDDISAAEGEQPLSEGSHTATVTVRDDAGNATTVGPWTIRRELTPPQLAVSGTLKAAEGQTLADDQDYSVIATATEESTSPPQSGMGAIDIVVDDEEPGDGVEEDCPEGGCRLVRESTYSTAEYGGGAHTVRVIATDRAGNTTEQTVAVNQPPDPVAGCDTPPLAAPVVNPDPLLPSLALASFQSADGLPEAFEPSTLLDLGELELLPALEDDDPLEFVATGVFSGVRVDRMAIDGATITVDSGNDQPICLTPTEVAIGASQPDAPVNGATALFANSHPATDTAIRPSITGVSSLLQLRSASAPQQFSWNVDLQPDLELLELPDGAVAVVEPLEPGTDVSGLEDPPAPPTVAEQRGALPDTAAHLSQDENELSRIQASQPDQIVAIVRAPWAKGPQGEPVSTSLATSLTEAGYQITMTVDRTLTQDYPVVAHMQVSDAVATDEGSVAKLDFEAVEWTEVEEAAFDETPPEDPSDPDPDSPPAADDAPADSSSEDDIDAYASAEELTVEGPGQEDPDAPGADLDAPDATTAGEKMSTLQARANQITVGTSEADVANEVLSMQSDQLNKDRVRRPMVFWNIAFLVKKEQADDLPNTKEGRCKSRAARKWIAYKRSARSRGLPVMPTFNLRISREKDCGPRPASPPVNTYRGAIDTFLDRNLWLKRITALNEPNLGIQADKRKPQGIPLPRRAAGYWVAANKECHNKGTVQGGHRCAAVPAGDFAGTPTDAAFRKRMVRPKDGEPRAKKVRYRATYHKHLFRMVRNDNKLPIIWAFHNWGDLHRFEVRTTRRFTAPITRHFRRTYARESYEYGKGEGKTPSVWVTEVGAAYRHTCRQIRVGRTDKERANFRDSPRRCGEPPPGVVNDQDGTYRDRDGDKRALRYGIRRQRDAVIFLFRIITMSEKKNAPPLAPIQRLYYYNTEDNRGARVSAHGDTFHTGRCAGSRRCPILESGLIGSLVDDRINDDPELRDSGGKLVMQVRDFGEGQLSPSLLSDTNEIRPAFCALKQKRTRPTKRVGTCSP